jgi:hypothetical protein
MGRSSTHTRRSLLGGKERGKRGKRRRSVRYGKGRTRKWRRTLWPREWGQHARSQTEAESEPRIRLRTAGAKRDKNTDGRMAERSGGRDPWNLG